MRFGVFNSLETAIIGGWFVIIGYFFLLFIYFLAFRYRDKRNLFHLGFGIFFLLLGVARAFFLVFDFYDPNVIWWIIATATSWAGICVIFFTLTYQILERQLWQAILLSLPPLVITILVLVLPQLVYPDPLLPTVPIGYVVVNGILVIYSIVLPLLFFYIGWRVLGQLRTSNFLIGGGFTIYYVGRIVQSSQVDAFLETLTPLLGDVLSPLLVFFALVFIAVGVLLEKHD